MIIFKKKTHNVLLNLVVGEHHIQLGLSIEFIISNNKKKSEIYRNRKILNTAELVEKLIICTVVCVHRTHTRWEKL